MEIYVLPVPKAQVGEPDAGGFVSCEVPLAGLQMAGLPLCFHMLFALPPLVRTPAILLEDSHT